MTILFENWLKNQGSRFKSKTKRARRYQWLKYYNEHIWPAHHNEMIKAGVSPNSIEYKFRYVFGKDALPTLEEMTFEEIKLRK